MEQNRNDQNRNDWNIIKLLSNVLNKKANIYENGTYKKKTNKRTNMKTISEKEKQIEMKIKLLEHLFLLADNSFSTQSRTHDWTIGTQRLTQIDKLSINKALEGKDWVLTCKRGLMVKLPAVGFIHAIYCVLLISFRVSLFLSYQ